MNLFHLAIWMLFFVNLKSTVAFLILDVSSRFLRLYVTSLFFLGGGGGFTFNISKVGKMWVIFITPAMKNYFDISVQWIHDRPVSISLSLPNNPLFSDLGYFSEAQNCVITRPKRSSQTSLENNTEIGPCALQRSTVRLACGFKILPAL